MDQVTPGSWQGTDASCLCFMRGTCWVAAVGGGCWIHGRPRRGGLCSRLALPQPVTPKECISEEWNFAKGTKQRLVALRREVQTWAAQKTLPPQSAMSKTWAV